jgi:hypothetical protein
MHFEVGTISGPSAIFMNSYIDDGRHLLGSIVGRIHRRDTQDHAVLDRLNRASSIPRIRHAIRGVRAFFPKLENLKTSRHTTPMNPARYSLRNNWNPHGSCLQRVQRVFEMVLKGM